MRRSSRSWGILLLALACTEVSDPTGVQKVSGASAVFATDSVFVRYACGNKFALENRSDEAGSVWYEPMYSGSYAPVEVTLPAKPAGRAYSLTFLQAPTNEGLKIRSSATGPVIRYGQNQQAACGASSVPTVFPDTIPIWAYEDSSLVIDSTYRDGTYTKDLLLVQFAPGTSIARRQDIIDLVRGSVVGGVHYFDDEGVYAIKVAAWGSLQTLEYLRSQLPKLPEVLIAAPNHVFEDGLFHLTPTDQATASVWSLHPDSTGTDDNWAFERVNAPLAWGCSTGDPSVKIAVLDNYFHDVSDLEPDTVSQTASLLSSHHHGTAVASIIGARGNNGMGMAGVMWNSSLRLYERGRAVGGPAGTIKDVPVNSARLFVRAVGFGARIVNISGGIVKDHDIWVSDSVRVLTAYEDARFMIEGMRALERAGYTVPLLVLAAGNWGGDARGATFPILADTFPDRVIVVGATQRSNSSTTLRTDSNRGSAVQIAAPGVDVMALNRFGVPVADFLRTSAAAPMVAGAAGLLLSFDPSLTALQLKSHLIAGAAVGGRLAANTGGPTIPLLNIYESLKVAASRIGAPLCGNRLWVSPTGTSGLGSLVAQRGSLVETIGGVDSTTIGIKVSHGGRRIEVEDWYSENGFRIFTYHSPGSWTDESDPWSMPSDTSAGAYWSSIKRSHDADMVASITSSTFDSVAVRVQKGGDSAWTVRVPSGVAIDPALAPKSTKCLVIVEYDETDECHRLWSATLVAENAVSATSSLAFVPSGDRVLLAVSRKSTGVGEWTFLGACTHTYYYYPEHNGRCYERDRYSSRLDTKLYMVNFRTGTWTPVFEMSGVTFSNLAVSEDGSEFVAEVASGNSLWHEKPNAWFVSRGEMPPGDSIFYPEIPVITSSTSTYSCHTRFLALTTLAQPIQLVSSAIDRSPSRETPGRCGSFTGGSGFSAVKAQPPMSKAPALPRRRESRQP
jgi:hypothetical protein